MQQLMDLAGRQTAPDSAAVHGKGRRIGHQKWQNSFIVFWDSAKEKVKSTLTSRRGADSSSEDHGLDTSINTEKSEILSNDADSDTDEHSSLLGHAAPLGAGTPLEGAAQLTLGARERVSNLTGCAGIDDATAPSVAETPRRAHLTKRSDRQPRSTGPSYAEAHRPPVDMDTYGSVPQNANTTSPPTADMQQLNHDAPTRPRSQPARDNWNTGIHGQSAVYGDDEMNPSPGPVLEGTPLIRHGRRVDAGVGTGKDQEMQ